MCYQTLKFVWSITILVPNFVIWLKLANLESGYDALIYQQWRKTVQKETKVKKKQKFVSDC